MSEQLDLRVKRPAVKLDLSVLPSIRSLNHAIAKCAELVGSIDKTVAIDTGIDSPTWARIKQGDAGVKGEFLDRLMDACGNELPLLWLLHSRGYDPNCIRKYETETEAALRIEKEKNASLEAKYAVAMELIGGRKAA